jgi:Tfp pilus assembly protein PilF
MANETSSFSDDASTDIAIGPEDLEAVEIQEHIDLGLSLYKSGEVHEAYVEFLQVLAIDPRDPIGHYLCGLTLQAFKLEDMALAEWAAASSLQVRDGGKWDSDWDWIKQKCRQFLSQDRQDSPPL